jgi:CRP-like cAMP-binding protein
MIHRRGAASGAREDENRAGASARTDTGEIGATSETPAAREPAAPLRHRRRAERNRLLLALPPRDYRALLPDLEPVILPHGTVIFEAHDRVAYVYFPQRCVISLLAAADDRPGVEVGLIGNDGMVGLSAFLGVTTASTQAVVQIPDGAWRMRVRAFAHAIASHASLRNVLSRYTQSVISQIAQGLACNQRHAVGPRCARWLLMAHDRVGEDRFELTQGFLGQMLGVRRPTVSLTAQGLQSLGLIRYTRGIMTVVDRAGLESAACTCYAVMEADYARAFG